MTGWDVVAALFFGGLIAYYGTRITLAIAEDVQVKRRLNRIDRDDAAGLPRSEVDQAWMNDKLAHYAKYLKAAERRSVDDYLARHDQSRLDNEDRKRGI